MEVVKEQDQSLLLNHFGLADKYYLTVSILLFFDLNEPADLLPEQELWPCVQDQLGAETIFDQGLPKPQGEVLMLGRCFAPGGLTTTGLRVSLRLGPINKSLYIFGRRHWRRRPNGLLTLSDPQPFQAIEVGYRNAFGGPDFPRNPLGKGLNPVRLPSGEIMVLAPNVEDPGHLISSPEDRPNPAGFGPYEITWPQRSSKLGTYDAKWLRERWPYFPEDMDYTFFNAAPPDQRLTGFWRGDEALLIENMNNARPLIKAHLPGVAVKCFATQLKNDRRSPSDAVFKEVKTNLDTVWLLPNAWRGVLIFRGVTEVADDEASDVRRLFLLTEKLHDPPRTLEEYLELEKERMKWPVPAVDMTPLEQAEKELAAARAELEKIPQLLDEALAEAAGRAPASTQPLSELTAGGAGQMTEAATRLAEARKRLVELKAEFGHLIKIDLSMLEEAQGELAAAAAAIQEVPGQVAQAQAEITQHQQEIKKAFQEQKKRLEARGIPTEGFEPDMLFEPKPDQLWREQGFRFVEDCRQRLQENQELMKILRSHGLSHQTIRRAWLGYNPVELSEPRSAWGLKEAWDDQGRPRNQRLPAGLVIPHFDGAILDRITIRTGDAVEAGTDFPVEGSKDLALTFISPRRPDVFLRVADELEAWLARQEASDLCSIIAAPDPSRKPAEETAKLIEPARAFLIAGPAWSEVQVDETLSAWLDVHPQAKILPLPVGRNLLEARRTGFDLRPWLLAALPPELSTQIEEELALIEKERQERKATQDFPLPDVQALDQKIRGSVDAALKPELENIAAMKKEMQAHFQQELKKFDEPLRKSGLNPDTILDRKEVALGDNPFDPAPMLASLGQAREKLKQVDRVDPEVWAKLDEAEGKIKRVTGAAAERYQAGMARIAEAESRPPVPDWALGQLKKAGIDVDDLEPLTREDVIERHKQGLSLAGKNLSGLDLSGLDLSGLDLKEAFLEKTVLAGSKLDGANLTEAVANEADFTGASLKGVRLDSGLFQQAKFTKAVLSGSSMTKALLKNADLTAADLQGAEMESALLEGAKLSDARLNDTKINGGSFLSSDLTGANLAGADISHGLFSEAALDKTDFSRAKARSAFFWQVKGREVNFTDTDMHNSRIGGGSEMPGADFSGADLSQACWRQAELHRADFRGARLEGSLIEECDLHQANLNRTQAKQTSFNKSDLSGGDLRGINLLNGSLRKTRLVDTDFSGANLYGVEFHRSVLGRTKLDGANLKMTKLHKRTDLLP
ncbi:MAG: DUF2169 domain-containing protein [Thermodesulfobacteriota bacterium]